VNGKSVELNLKFIDNIIINMRLHRMHTVQAEEQYLFILELFTNILINNEYSNDYSKFQGFTDKFNTLHTIKRAKECTSENRYINILPYDLTIVELIDNYYNDYTINKNCKDYINSNYLNYYDDLSEIELNNLKTLPVKSKKAESDLLFKGYVIASQGPKDNTKGNFLRMLASDNIKRIIMVTGLEESDKKKCSDYTSVDNNLSNLVANTDYGNYTEYTLKNDSDDSDKLVLTDGIQKKPEQLNIVTKSTTSRKLASQPRKLTMHKPQTETTELKKSQTIKLRRHNSNNSNNARKNDLIERINSFITLRPNLSFCDCKIILLYILVNKLLTAETKDVAEYQKIKTYIMQDYNYNYKIRQNNLNLFSYTMDIINKITIKIHRKLIKKIHNYKIQKKYK